MNLSQPLSRHGHDLYTWYDWAETNSTTSRVTCDTQSPNNLPFVPGGTDVWEDVPIFICSDSSFASPRSNTARMHNYGAPSRNVCRCQAITERKTENEPSPTACKTRGRRRKPDSPSLRPEEGSEPRLDPGDTVEAVMQPLVTAKVVPVQQGRDSGSLNLGREVFWRGACDSACKLAPSGQQRSK